MPDIYIFSYYKHRNELYHMLPTVKRYVDYDNLCVVWDDIYPEPESLDWSLYEDQLGQDIKVINQSTLYDWQEHDIVRGWHRQQYSKLLVPTYSKQQYNIMCDSECFFIRPYTVFENQKPILYLDNDWVGNHVFHPFIEQYLGKPVDLTGTYVGSCSLWDAELVQYMWDQAYKLNNMDLIHCCREFIDNAVPDNDPLEDGSYGWFCEFEMYGVFAEDSHVVKPYNFRYVNNDNPWKDLDNTYIELLIFWDHFLKDTEERWSAFKEWYEHFYQLPARG